MMMSERRSLTARLPTYSAGQHFLRIVEGMSASGLVKMRDDILEQTGKPQSTVKWSDPEQWIPERLSGDSLSIALRLWRDSDKLTNPRYFAGFWSLCEKHKLLVYPSDKITLTDAGKRFLANDEKQLARMDDYDGLLIILKDVAEKGPGFRKDFLEGYRHFCRTRTTWVSESSIKWSLSHRLSNLVQRNLVEKHGVSYQVTETGIDYLQRRGNYDTSPLSEDAAQAVPAKQTRSEFDPDLANLIRQKNWTARQQLRGFLQTMDPFKLEHLVKLLLEEMGYENVNVTSPVSDKGVDVTADLELGISRVREVIQVKRQKSNVNRTVLDSLRGSLHRFDAVRGTIITTGGFAKGAKGAAFEKGAAPITLIDGERFLDLLIEKNIGIRRREIRVVEFDRDSLAEFESDDGEIAL